MKNYEGVGTARFRFEFSGGRLAVDFANTVGNRHSSEPIELLPTYDSVVSWAQQAGALTREEATRLREASARRRAAAPVAWKRAVGLRDALFRLFDSLARHKMPPADALATLDALLAEALSRRRIQRQRGRWSWAWADDSTLDRVLWPVALDAAELLTSTDIESIGSCAAADCGWLFLDTSRNRRRKWCDMTVCGNRAKNRAFHRRAARSESARA